MVKFYPLTHPQKRIIFTELLTPGNDFNNIPFTLSFPRGCADLVLKALEVVVNHNQDLRLQFIQTDGEVEGLNNIKQYIAPMVEKLVDYFNFKERPEELANWLTKQSTQPFSSLYETPLYYFAILETEEKLLLYSKFHHLIFDGQASALFSRQVIEVFTALQENRPYSLPETNYLAYLEQEEEYKKSQRFGADREYWLNTLTPLPEEPDFFASHHRSLKIKHRIVSVPDHLREMVKNFRQNNSRRIPLFRFLLTVSYIYFARCFNRPDLLIGIPYANRRHPAQIRDSLGMLVSTLPVRLNMEGKINFNQALDQVEAAMEQAILHSNYPYDLLIQDLRKENAFNGDLLNFTVTQNNVLSLGQHKLEFIYYSSSSSPLSIRINLGCEDTKTLQVLAFEYQEDVFSEWEIENIEKRYLQLLEDILHNPDLPLQELNLLPTGERQMLLADFNDTCLPVPKNKTYLELFREQAVKTPENIAVVDCRQSLTYAQLDQLTDILAARLHNLGIVTNSIVGIMVPRTVDFVIGTLAIMKAGGAYLPVDPEYPEARIKHMLSDSKTAVLLSREEFRDKALEFHGHFVDLGAPDLFAYPSSKPEIINKPSDLAYIIYTSGSTGKPKGVMITQANLVNLTSWHNNHYQITEQDVSAAYSSFSFDVSVKQIFPFLLTGASVHILTEQLLLDLAGLNSYLEANKVTFVDLPTQLAEAFMENYDHRSLRYLTTGGDKLRTYTQRSYQLINEYGPTEFTVSATYFTVDKQYTNIPIGKPLGNSWAYVLDKEGALQPIGVPGELCLAGSQIAKGYLSRPELTAEKFVPNPYATCPENALMYKTGDLVRWLPDGNLEYLGRIDMQVKVRGYRIELGEIELAILNFPGITNTVVVDLLDSSGSKYLCAYLVAEKTIELENLKQLMAKELPHYMVPSVFMKIPAIPVNPNGKVDRRALPIPNLSDSKNEYAAPTTALQVAICKLWEEILGVDRVGIKDDFFALGGTSIKAIALQTKLQQSLGSQIAVGDIFNNPTPELLAVLVEGSNKYLPISIAPQADSYPLTPPQRQMYILRQALTEETVYNIPAAFTLKGLLDRDRLEAAFTALIKRHAALRTYFVNVEGEPRQKIIEQSNFRLDYHEAGRNEVWKTITSYNYPFNLAEPLLFRAGLITVAKDEHVLFFIAHHIILDGLSIDVLVNDLQVLYAGQDLPPVRIGYPDFALWQRERLTEAVLATQEKYWMNQFADEVPALELVTDYPRPPVMSHQGAVVTQTIDEKLTQALKRLAQENKTTLFTVLLTGYMALLARYAGKEDLVVGVPFAGRVHPDVETTVGMFVSTLPLRSRPEYQKTFKNLLAEVKEQVAKAQENQDYPLETLVQKLGIRPDPARNPLFDVVFNFLSKLDPKGELAIEEYQGKADISHFDLSLTIEEMPTSLKASFNYCTKLYCQETMERMLDHYLTLLSLAVENLNSCLKDFSLLSKEESKILLESFNHHKLDCPNKTIVDLFREQTARTPKKIALVFNEQQITYAELDRLTDLLAKHLTRMGAGREKAVGILVERSAEMVIAALGVIKSGAAYLPLDPAHPAERLQFMLEDAQTVALITQSNLKQLAGDFKGDFLDITKLNELEDLGHISLTSPAPENLFILLYTSGSTGKPKGVMLEQKSIVNFCYWYRKYYQVTENDISAAYSSFGFDASMMDVYPFLISGATIHIIPEEMRLNLGSLNEYLETNGVTLTFMTTQLGRQFVENYANKSLRTLSVGGERFQPCRLPEHGFVNAYGPTECTIFTTTFTIDQDYPNMPIGKPLANTWVYILDPYGNLQPMGVPGELCIAGVQVARGYLNRPDLTAEKFVSNPYATCPDNARMYKTGDLARWLPDGNLEYINRMDQQVKIRGFRIELGEIEQKILQFPGITDAVVVDLNDSLGGKYLCAYLVAPENIELESLKQLLAKDLPYYMVPSVLMPIPALPVNQNGKVDKRALPTPELSDSKGEYVAPTTDLQAAICKLWEEILGVERVGIKDDFFALGGTSIKAIALQTKLQKSFGSQIAVGDIFNNPTPELLAVLVEGTKKYAPIPVAALAESYPLTPPQRQMYILRQTLTDETAYNISCIFTIQGLLDKARFAWAFDQLVQRHSALRTYFVDFDGEPVQKIATDLQYKKLYRKASSQEEIPNIIADWVRPFNLAKPPLFNLGLIEFSQEEHVLFLDAHHIILDGLSINVLINDLLTLYTGQELPLLKIGYHDFAVWQQKRLTETALATQEKYWLDLFADEVPALELVTDYPRPPVMSHQGAVVAGTIDEKLTQALNRLAQENKTTLFTVLLTGYMALLARYAGKEDVVVGVPFAGRVHPDLERTVGMFVSTLALRGRPEYSKTFKTLLEEVKGQVIKAQENQDYPLEKLVQKLGILPDPSRNPLFDVLFNFLPKIGQEESGDLKILPYSNEEKKASFDLTLNIQDFNENLKAQIIYCNKLFCSKTVERILHHYFAMLSALVDNLDLPLKDVSLLTDQEQEILLDKFNQNCLPIPGDKTYVDLFREQVAKTPDNIAVIDYHQSLTYAELDQLTDSLAIRLHDLGVEPDQIVGIMVPRTADFVIGTLAIMKAGGAYLPISADYPEGRIQHLITDSKISVLLGVKEFKEKAIGFNGTFIDLEAKDLFNYPGEKLEKINQPSDLAYIIYTSGSTGKPKGVMISHTNLINLCMWHNNQYQTTAEDICALYFNTSFDASVKQVFPFLIKGGAVLIIPEDLLLDISGLNNYLMKNKATFIGLPTQFAETFMESCDNSFLKYMIVGGEKLRSYKPQSYQLINEYGPTEFTVCSTYFPVKQELDNIPIGKPVANSWLYVLDKQEALQPIGVPGELCLAGTQIARGYLNRPELTAEKFVPNPYSTCPENAFMYKTGDLVRWLPDGNLEYLGRIDMQVKIRGYRIELGEIEQVMLSHPQITDTVVTALTDLAGSKYLCGYYVSNQSLDEEEIKQLLSRELPSYMVPTALVPIDAIPLTPNGKVDKNALPVPELKVEEGEQRPLNQLEERIAGFWREVLGMEIVRANDNFFNLGGTSLKAVSLITKLQQYYEVNINTLFEHQTLEQFTQYVTPKKGNLKERLAKIKEMTSQEVSAGEPELDSEAQEKLRTYAERATGIDNLDLGRLVPYQAVLLAGATGYLGIHLLRELFVSRKCQVYALVRGQSSTDAQQRLTAKLSYYFGEEIAGEIMASGRVTVVPGDLKAENLGLEQAAYQKLAGEVDAIVNAAANVRHYGHYDQFYEDNVQTVINLIVFARQSQTKGFAHVSTTSVGSGTIPGVANMVFTEDDCDLGQQIDNYYVKTKWLAEKEVIAAREEGINTSIYRVGNLTCSLATGTTQDNIRENGFFSRFSAFVNMGVVAQEYAAAEFTYVDCAAQAILLLFERENLQNRNFHIVNPKTADLAKALTHPSLNLDIAAVSAAEFIDCLYQNFDRIGFKSHIENTMLHMGWLLDEADTPETRYIHCVEETVNILQRLGFEWQELEPILLENMLEKALKERIMLMRKASIFAGLDEQALFELAGLAKQKVYGIGDFIYSEGQSSGKFHLLLEGFAEISKKNFAGWDNTIFLYKEGDFLGLENVLGHQAPSSITAETLFDDLLALEFAGEAIKKFIYAHPQLSLGIMAALNERQIKLSKLWINAD